MPASLETLPSEHSDIFLFPTNFPIRRKIRLGAYLSDMKLYVIANVPYSSNLEFRF